MPRQGLHPPCLLQEMETKNQDLVQPPGKRIGTLAQEWVKELDQALMSNSVQWRNSLPEERSVQKSHSVQESVQAAERPPFGTS